MVFSNPVYVIDFLGGPQIFEIYVLVENNLCEKLFSSLESPAVSDEKFKVTSVPFFIADFNFLSCELDNFIFNLLYLVIFILKQK